MTLHRLPSGRIFNTDLGTTIPLDAHEKDKAVLREWVANLPPLFEESEEVRQFTHWLWSLRVGDIVGLTLYTDPPDSPRPALLTVRSCYNGSTIAVRDAPYPYDPDVFYVRATDSQLFRPTVDEIRTMTPNESRYDAALSFERGRVGIT